MNELHKLLIKEINLGGPITVAQYMKTALFHPKHGYYQQKTAFGDKGDFITAPDISQMFGEMIGLFCVDRWHAMGKPNKFALVELGPGRGRLMSDIIFTTKNFTEFQNALSIHFVEKGARRKKEQEQILSDTGWTKNVAWFDHLSDIPNLPAIILANEFFDALPIHQFVYDGQNWLERCITADNDKLTYCLTPASPALSFKSRNSGKADKGDILEICPDGFDTITIATKHLTKNKGVMLFIDYGFKGHLYGDTFQAVKAHKFHDPLQSPGDADLTAHVAFTPLLDHANAMGGAVFGPVEQGQFLMALGIGMRAQNLAKGRDKQKQEKILSELKRLTSPLEMGELFKAAAVQSPGMSPPPGFST